MKKNWAYKPEKKTPGRKKKVAAPDTIKIRMVKGRLYSYKDCVGVTMDEMKDFARMIGMKFIQMGAVKFLVK